MLDKNTKGEDITPRDLWEIRVLAFYGFTALERAPNLFESLEYSKILEAIDRNG